MFDCPLLVGDKLVNFGDILPETSKNSACWDMGQAGGRGGAREEGGGGAREEGGGGGRLSSQSVLTH